MRDYIIALALLAPVAVSAKSVFAHFMVGNTEKFSEADWRTQINLAQTAKIDAFALNMANDENTTTTQLPNAFAAAEALKFKLFFSFDMRSVSTPALVQFASGDVARSHSVSFPARRKEICSICWST